MPWLSLVFINSNWMTAWIHRYMTPPRKMIDRHLMSPGGALYSQHNICWIIQHQLCLSICCVFTVFYVGYWTGPMTTLHSSSSMNQSWGPLFPACFFFSVCESTPGQLGPHLTDTCANKSDIYRNLETWQIQLNVHQKRKRKTSSLVCNHFFWIGFGDQPLFFSHCALSCTF